MTRAQRSVGTVKYLHLQERSKSPNFVIEELEEMLNWSRTSLIAWKQIARFFSPHKDATALCLLFVSGRYLNSIQSNKRNREISVSIVTRLRSGHFRVLTPGKASDYCVLQYLQTGSGVHPASSSLDTWVVYQGLSNGGREFDL
jgi:hypothetical protein